jgi:hypothetical protein
MTDEKTSSQLRGVVVVDGGEEKRLSHVDGRE